MLPRLRVYLTSDTLAVLVGNVGSVLARFVLNIVIARLAGAHEMGVYVTLGALAIIVSRLTDLGLPNAVVYFARLHRSVARRCVIVCFIHCALALPLSVALLHVGTLFGLVEIETIGQVGVLLLGLGALATMQLLNSLLGQLLITVDSFKSYGIATLLSPLLAISLCLAWPDSLQVADLVLITLSGEVGAIALALAMLWRSTAAASATPAAVTTGDIYSYGVKTYFGTAVKAVGQRSDRLVLAWFAPSSTVAAYAIAIALRDAAMLPVTAHATVLRNRFIDLASSTAGAAVLTKDLRRELVRWFIALAVLAAGFAAVTPMLVPYVYGPQFQPVAPLFSILFATLPMLAVSGFCSTLMLSVRRAGAVSVGFTIGAALNVAGLYVGASMAGYIGAAWGAVAAAVATAAWWLIVGFRSGRAAA